ncbi:uncharacterized protein [Rutidosis leptorrhynchoides]|uniref:uncharacterized protein isoform X2 n=1 Tax=Rutidosis leptorrhynchoides TaxID=125765 RepID=UPI003A992C80
MENAKDNEIDLGLSLGITNQRAESCSNTSAGANADSKSKTGTIGESRPIKELVWSRKNGLRIKCAGCRNCFVGIKPCILMDVGPIQMVSPSQDDENCVIAQATCHAGSVKSSPDYFLGSSVGQTVKEPARLETKAEIIKNGKDIFSLDIGLPLKIQEHRPPPNLAKEKCSSSAPILEKIEETAENDVIVKDDTILKNEGLSRNESGSMESCNSANLLSRRDKRLRFEEQLIIGSKRIKKQSQECHMVKQQDSSFMNWISNMVKGNVKPHQEVGHRHIDKEDKTLNVVNKRCGFHDVFQSLYSQDAKRLQTKLLIENSSNPSKEIVLFEKPPDDSLNQKAFGKSWITRFSPKTPSTSTNNSDLKDFVSASVGSEQFKKPVAIHSKITSIFCDQKGHELHDCLEMNENKNVFFKKKVSNLHDIPKPIASSSENIKVMNENKILRIPKEMFDTVRRLRLSRTDILKWMNSSLPIAKIDGYFLRLRLAKGETEVGGAGYYVAFITDENQSQGSKKPIRVNIGGVQCLVESRYISNCDFLEDELIAWWRTTLTSGDAPIEKNLTSKLEERKKLGF